MTRIACVVMVLGLCVAAFADPHGNCCRTDSDHTIVYSTHKPPSHELEDDEVCYLRDCDWHCLLPELPDQQKGCYGEVTCPNCGHKQFVIGRPNGYCSTFNNYSYKISHSICQDPAFSDGGEGSCSHGWKCAECEQTFEPPWW